MTAEDIQALTARLPRDLYERLRRASYERHVPQNTILCEALAEHLDRSEAGEHGGR